MVGEEAPLQRVDAQEQGVTSVAPAFTCYNSMSPFRLSSIPSSKVPVSQMFPPPPVVPVQPLARMKSTFELVWR